MARILHHPYATTDELLNQAADVLTVADMDNAWTSFTCIEVEVIAELFRHFRRDKAADAIVAIHAKGDEPGDDHYSDPAA